MSRHPRFFFGIAILRFKLVEDFIEFFFLYPDLRFLIKNAVPVQHGLQPLLQFRFFEVGIQFHVDIADL